MEHKAVTFTECPHQPPTHPQPEADLGWVTNVWAGEKKRRRRKKRKRLRRGGAEEKKRKEKEKKRRIEEKRVRKVLSLVTGVTN